MGNPESPQGKIIRILKTAHISSSYTPSDFTNEDNYATFELAATPEIAEGLEKAINSHFSESISGIFASIRQIATKTIKEGKLYKYALEIVPDETMKFDARQKEEETQKFLEKLPGEISNYLRMNRCH